MWEWREDIETAREPQHGEWRLDHYGTWFWEPRRDPYAAARVERLRPAMAALADPAPLGAARLRGLDGWEPTPIFRSVSSDRDRDRHRQGADSAARRAAIPEPHPGSGPLPVQRPGERRLAPVETVPPPPPCDDDVAGGSAQDELRRRAERRRRPHREHGGAERGAGAGGRHAMRAVPADDRGRHAFR